MNSEHFACGSHVAYPLREGVTLQRKPRSAVRLGCEGQRFLENSYLGLFENEVGEKFGEQNLQIGASSHLPDSSRSSVTALVDPGPREGAANVGQAPLQDGNVGHAEDDALVTPGGRANGDVTLSIDDSGEIGKLGRRGHLLIITQRGVRSWRS